ncbi:MAG: beta-galactosidase [Armatimonadota bacterium]|nr:beta-galactosidase [Armatimonadota bacterium]
MFPYGAQYYRTPNPPESEWEKDFRTMAENGFTIAKIWAMWNWMHTSDDTFDFSHFDRLFELAEKYHIKLVINTILENAPYWLIERHRDALYVASDGQVFEPIARSNTPGGGWPGLCLDNEPVRKMAEKFLVEIAKRYLDHPMLWGYDVWNEVFFEPLNHPGFEGRFFCYCNGTKARFIEWLKAKYGAIDELNKAWYRRYSDWGQVYPPRYWGSYPDWLDWLKFRLENQRDLMRWRIQVFRSIDQKHPLTSHGIAYTLQGMPTHLTNDFDIAQEVDQWGLSAFPMWANLHSSDFFRMLDLVRSASAVNGKQFWQNELQGGQSGNGLARSRTPRAEDTAFWNWTSFMCGAKGLMYWQWRPELLGPESPGFGLCRIDGKPSDRTEAAAWFASFMNSDARLLEAKPIKGEAAILVLPESQLFCFVADGKTDHYAHSVFGIYRALWNVNLQVDFCTIEHINEYPLVFLPFPLMIEKDHAEALKAYVAGGGVLVSDAAPCHFTDHGYTSMRIPGMGLDEVFGAIEDEMEYVPTLTQGGAAPPAIVWDSMRINCSVYQEKLIPTTGEVVARFDDGSVAVVDNSFGKGKARLIGTFPGVTYFRTLDHEPELLIRDALRYAGVRPLIQPLDTFIKARIQRGPSGDFLWVLNTDYQTIGTEITLLPSLGDFTQAEDLVTGEIHPIHDSVLRIKLDALKGTVLRLA